MLGGGICAEIDFGKSTFPIRSAPTRAADDDALNLKIALAFGHACMPRLEGYYADNRSWHVKIRRRPFRSHSERTACWVSICLRLWALDCRFKQVISHDVEASLNSPSLRHITSPAWVSHSVAAGIEFAYFVLPGREVPFCISTAKRLCCSGHTTEFWLDVHSGLEVSFTVPCCKI
jgi:hypothetical protein